MGISSESQECNWKSLPSEQSTGVAREKLFVQQFRVEFYIIVKFLLFNSFSPNNYT